MADNTKIDYVDASWNPIRGCSKVSAGCKNCWAVRMANRQKSMPGYEGFVEDGNWTGKVALIESQLTVPLPWRKPRRIAVAFMGDLFHPNLPDEARDRVFAVMALTYRMWCDDTGNHREPLHKYLVLTKRPERMREYVIRLAKRDWVKEWFDIPVVKAACEISRKRGDLLPGNASIPVVQWLADGMPGLWLGVSVEDQAHKDRIDILRDTPAALRFLSLEPLLGDLGTLNLDGIGWVIAGGESGPGARPCDVQWIRSVVEQCKGAQVPCYVKQLGVQPIQESRDWARTSSVPASWVPGIPESHRLLRLQDRKGAHPAEWPEDLRVRQMPEVRR
jgi:protein gp37